LCCTNDAANQLTKAPETCEFNRMAPSEDFPRQRESQLRQSL
jgi:hypothetical protein